MQIRLSGDLIILIFVAYRTFLFDKLLLIRTKFFLQNHKNSEFSEERNSWQLFYLNYNPHHYAGVIVIIMLIVFTWICFQVGPVC